MMADNEQELLPVTQADRDRAMRILNFAFRNTDVEISGECFDDMASELARHRHEALTSGAVGELVSALADDEKCSLGIIANAFRAAEMSPQSLFGEAYEPGLFIKSIVEQVTALKVRASIEEGGG